jgi:hypothetical protein
LIEFYFIKSESIRFSVRKNVTVPSAALKTARNISSYLLVRCRKQ